MDRRANSTPKEQEKPHPPLQPKQAKALVYANIQSRRLQDDWMLLFSAVSGMPLTEESRK